MPRMILCIGTTPAAQRVMVFRRLALDAVNRAVMTWDGAAGKSVNVAKVLQALGEQPVATGFLGGARGEQVGRGAVLNLAGRQKELARARPRGTARHRAGGRGPPAPTAWDLAAVQT